MNQRATAEAVEAGLGILLAVRETAVSAMV